MDAVEIRRLRPELVKYLGEFAECFGRKDTRQHLTTYVEGQLSSLERKSVEPIALSAGVRPRTLQQFLNSLVWDQEQLIDTLQWRVAREHTSPRSIGLLDDTSCPKKGDKTPGVQRQWCGATGKQDNCVTSVHLGYAADDFHCLLDSELYLPESWATDRARCREAGIPDELSYRPKWRIGLELYDRARANHVTFAYLTFDENYGGKPEFLRELDRRQQRYVAEVPRSFTGWLQAPQVTQRPFRKGRKGRGRATPRLVAGSPQAQSIEYHLNWTPALKDQPWQQWHVKDTQKGPLVWETKRVPLVTKDEQGLPGATRQLLVARNALDHDEVKYFLSNAPEDTSTAELLLVAFSRWRVERCFEDQKTELGFDHFEGRSYLGLKRHQAITALTHLFLSEVQQALREKKSRVDGLSGPHRRRRAGPRLALGSPRRTANPGGRRRRHRLHPAPQRRRPPQPHPHETPKTRGPRHPPAPTPQMRLGHYLAL
jgi:SRSO17 transposase